MKPIVSKGLYLQIASVALWTTLASGQPVPAGESKGNPEAARKAPPTSATPPASAATAQTGGEATASGTESVQVPKSGTDVETSAASAAPADVEDQAASNEEGKKGKKKGKKKKGKKDGADDAADADQATAAQADNGEFVGDFMAGDPWGKTRGALRAKGLTFRFLAQAQYQQSFGVESSNADATYRLPEENLAKGGDGWDVSRLFFGITAEPSKYLHLKLMTDFAEFRKNNSKKAVKQAYVELRPMPKHLHIAVGILKLPFSIHELDSIAAYEFTSSGRANALLNKLDIAGRDIGASVIVAPLEKQRYLKLTVGAYQGHATNENASPLGTIGARIESEFLEGFRLGAGMISMPKSIVKLNPLDTSSKNMLANPDNPLYPRAETWKKGNAFGADITFQRAGFMVRGEGLIGDRVDYDTRYGAVQWAAAWGILAYQFDAGPIKLEPAVRVEYLDTDFKRAAGLYRQFTLAVGTHFNSATKLIIDATRMIVEDNTPVIDQPRPLREIPYNALSATTLTARLQVAL